MEERASQLEQAVASMSYRELRGMHYLAQALLKPHGDALGYGPDDLIHEALLKILTGERLWNPKTAFYPFICGCMKSIVWNWKKKRHGTVSLDDSEFFDDDGNRWEIPSLTNFGNQVPAKIDAETVLRWFEGDSLALEVLNHWMYGRRRKEILKAMKIPDRKYGAVVKRIWRKAKKEGLKASHP